MCVPCSTISTKCLQGVYHEVPCLPCIHQVFTMRHHMPTMCLPYAACLVCHSTCQPRVLHVTFMSVMCLSYANSIFSMALPCVLPCRPFVHHVFIMFLPFACHGFTMSTMCLSCLKCVTYVNYVFTMCLPCLCSGSTSCLLCVCST